MNRVRFQNNIAAEPLVVAAEYYGRSPSCSDDLIYRPNGGSTGSIATGSYKSMRDVVVPGFHRRSSKGEVFFNPCYSTKTTLESSGGLTTELTSILPACSPPYAYYGRSRHTVTGPVGAWMSGFRFRTQPDGSLVSPASIIDPGALSAAMREVSTACLSNIGKSDSNLYESLAEANKSAGLLGGLIDDANRIISKPGFAKAKGAANAYLALRYGLAPLMKDVEGVLLGLKASTGKTRQTYRATVSVSGSNTVQGSSTYLGSYTTSNTFVSSEVATLRAMSLNEYYATLASNIGFTTKGLLTLPWELIPYSFVVDWFSNVGDFIGALVPDANMTQLGSCIATRSVLTENFNMTITGPIDTSYALSTGGQCYATRVTETYSRSPGLEAPGLVIKSDFRLSNLTRASDAIALLVQKLRP